MFLVRLGLSLAVGICSLIVTLPTHANDTKLNGFLRAGGAITTDDETYLERIDKNGDFGDTHFGLNISRNMGNNWTVAGQVFSSGAEGGSYEVILDWAYASYQLSNEIVLNAGKIKYPGLLVSDYIDIGIAYPWVRAPQEVYNFDVEGRPNISLESYVGGSAIYSSYMGDAEYSAQLFVGNGAVEEGSLDKMIGGMAKLSSELYTLQLAFNRHMPNGTTGEGDVAAEKNGKDVSVFSLGAKVDWNNMLVMGEYVDATVSDEEELDTTAMYATLGYQIGKYMPHLTYASLDAEEGSSTIGIGVKYQLSSSSTFKIDYLNVTPDAEEGEEEESFGVVSAAIDFVF